MTRPNSTDKNTLRIDDSDGELHLIICAALNGDRWAAQFTFDKDKRTATALKQHGDGLVSATVKSLLKAKIISV